MEADLRAHLAAAAPVAALVDDHIQWGVREEGQAIALHLISAPPEWHLKGSAGLTIARVQADCWASTYAAAKAIGDAVIASLPAIGQVVGQTKFRGVVPIDLERGDFGDAPNKLFRTRIDLRVSFSPA